MNQSGALHTFSWRYLAAIPANITDPQCSRERSKTSRPLTYVAYLGSSIAEFSKHARSQPIPQQI